MEDGVKLSNILAFEPSDWKSGTFSDVFSSFFVTYLYTMNPVGRGPSGRSSGSSSWNSSEGGKSDGPRESVSEESSVGGKWLDLNGASVD